MNKYDALKEFKRIYPEKEIIATVEIINDQYCLIDAEFPDGEFYFIVSKNTVSASYNSRSMALKSINYND